MAPQLLLEDRCHNGRNRDTVDRMEAVIYLRVSTQGQAVDGYGLDVQEQACRAYSESSGFSVAEVFRDEAVSGTLPAHERPGLMDALGMLKDGDADVLIVARLDRLARQLTTQEVILAEVWKDGAEVHTAESGKVFRDDPDDPMRTAMRQMAGVFAELDRAMTVKRLRDGRRAKEAKGGKANGSYPYGFAKEGPIPAELEVMRDAAAQKRKGRSWEAIAADLNARQITQRNGKPWTRQNLARVMR